MPGAAKTIEVEPIASQFRMVRPVQLGASRIEVHRFAGIQSNGSLAPTSSLSSPTSNDWDTEPLSAYPVEPISKGEPSTLPPTPRSQIPFLCHLVRRRDPRPEVDQKRAGGFEGKLFDRTAAEDPRKSIAHRPSGSTGTRAAALPRVEPMLVAIGLQQLKALVTRLRWVHLRRARRKSRGIVLAAVPRSRPPAASPLPC